MSEIVVIGGGLAGSEAAWQAAERGCRVTLYEMRPEKMTPAHQSGQLAELVCSNSLGSNLVDRAPGLLKQELRVLGSMVLACADAAAVPAGAALAVDREAFSGCVTERVACHEGITLVREELRSIPEEGIVVVATGPLTSAPMSDSIASLTGSGHLSFYDAMAPIVAADSVDLQIAFRASRYGRGSGGLPLDGEGGDYINCPMSREDYDVFLDKLLGAETIPLRGFEREDAHFFEACLPVEELARRGPMALAFGPLKPVGLRDPRTGRRPFAVVQLRQDNLAATLYNLVGFQTNLKWGEQERVFRLIPGLAHAAFMRYGQMHRNTFLCSPALLKPTLQYSRRDGLLFAGQLTGTEGYIGSVASGLVAGLNAARLARGESPVAFPGTTMIGALCRYVSGAEAQSFQPMKPNFGLLPPLDPPISQKRDRYQAYAVRALADLGRFTEASGVLLHRGQPG
ncbi:MAG TPA: methylenetetrahydrofolate--tRNA-(uracil(54)-C(5))-methyltransferase (FADH(2)-oxidizing) TrmFO [Anaerolineae bacterium]|nr:methylenetetrahydrofolate--tRNA-(uracil(54)-C(5))-methyltransferase (FADH(2)-oxidizing) TrmFO [Anaerolineae bacterium]